VPYSRDSCSTYQPGMETATDWEMTETTGALRRAATGIAGLDDVLAGGLARPIALA
jgi:hypothetical protein